MAIFNYRNIRGDVLELSSASDFALVNIDAQTSAATSISSLVIGGADGDDITNIQATPRTIILDLRITGNVEDTKRRILNIVKLKQKGTLVWSQNERTLEIEGVIESITMPRWTNATLMQISMHCEQPFWTNLDDVITEINQAISLHYFTANGNMLVFPSAGIAIGELDTLRTREIHNAGDVAVGMEIEIIALDTVTNPILYNQDGLFFGCGHGTGTKQIVMDAGDVIKINTNRNQKSVKLNNTNILGKIKPNSTWLQLEAGDNTFSINSDDVSTTNMTYNLKYKQRYI